MTDDRKQRADDRIQITEDGRQRADIEIGIGMSEGRISACREFFRFLYQGV
jgi:hypothetical protein